MLYCEKCKAVFEHGACPFCGKSIVHKAENGDFVLLIEKPQVWTGIVEGMLEDHDIPYTKRNAVGVGLTLRAWQLFERYRYFVPYDRYDEARALMDEAFSQTGEDQEITTQE